ncbi:MAG: RNA polymerase sigma factor [Candidatus Margulisbacteria bacterium]|jgi:RNA polymerase sigma-70 factor (ECF subfamily)|nr:RNA polymerase sigma factor [Candidatus Margulisiibacteriota bacterium]
MAKADNYAAEFRAGDAAAFKRMYEDTSALLYRVVFRLTGSREDAEDILHDVYIKAYQARRSYQPQLSGLQTWLYRIAVNHALNFLKRKKWLGGNLANLFGRQETEDVAESYAGAAENETLQKLLQEIPENYRVCVVLRDIEDRPYDEIAGILNVELGTVKSRLSRGRQILKSLYERSERPCEKT